MAIMPLTGEHGNEPPGTIAAAMKAGKSVQMTEMQVVKSYAPGVSRVVVDAVICSL